MLSPPLVINPAQPYWEPLPVPPQGLEVHPSKLLPGSQGRRFMSPHAAVMPQPALFDLHPPVMPKYPH
ncbi:hypothetical protein FKM82_004359 [Ascaphus truei]